MEPQELLSPHDPEDENIVTVDGLRIRTRPNSSDQIIVKDNLEWHAWEKHGITIKANDPWLDCGGYIGTFSLRAASLGARVLAFEPDPIHVGLWLDNYALNPQISGWATLCPKAVVSENRGPLQLTRNDFKGNWAANTLFPYWKKARGTVEVECISFADAFQMGLDVLGATELSIKMDAEGAEIEILEALDESLAAKIKQWAFEYHFFLESSTCERYWAIQRKLESFGFKVKTSDKVPESGLWKNPRKRHMMVYCTRAQ